MATSRLAGEANWAFAKAFTDMFSDTTYAIILGRKQQNEHGITPSSGSYAASINGFYGDVGLVLPEYSAPMRVCKHIKWKRVMFISWDPNKDQESQAYYCEHNNKVYLCLDNNNGSISGVAPTGTRPEPFRTDDGYLWQYLYSISGIMNNYKRNLGGVDWMPVQDRKTQIEIDELSTTNPYNLKYEVEKRGLSNGGELIRVEIKKDDMKDIRWDTAISSLFVLWSDTDNPAQLDAVFDYIGPSEEVDSNKRGYKLERVDIVERGKGYPMNNVFSMGAEPSTASQNNTGYDSTHIVGGAASTIDSDIQGPFVYAIASPEDGFGDAIGLLNANRAMFLMVLDPKMFEKYTDGTEWNTASIVKNPLYKDKPISDTISPGKQSIQATYFSAATKIKVQDNSVSAAMKSGDYFNSVSSSNRSVGTITSNNTNADGGRNINITGQGSKTVSTTDKLFGEVSPDTFVSGKYTTSYSTGNTPSNTQILDVEKTPLSMGKDSLGNYTEVLHTFVFDDISFNADAAAQIGHTLTLAFMIG